MLPRSHFDALLAMYRGAVEPSSCQKFRFSKRCCPETSSLRQLFEGRSVGRAVPSAVARILRSRIRTASPGASR